MSESKREYTRCVELVTDSDGEVKPMRSRKPTDVFFPVPNLGFQTDNFVDTLIEAVSESKREYTRCKFCGHRWEGVEVPFVSGAPLPGKDLTCPQCGLDGATIVLDFDPQRELL